MPNNLDRFLKAQEKDFDIALSEIKKGQKKSHWMWYIFPQLKGLGSSDTARYYALRDISEAKEFINHPVLGMRLKEISKALLQLNQTNAHEIFGSPDDLKLKSCMTLFSLTEKVTDNIFQKVLQKFFSGQTDLKTLELFNRDYRSRDNKDHTLTNG